MNHQELSENELDILKEISNIGVGNAVTSLSQLINRRVDMRVPRACFLSFEEVIALVGGYEELVTCVSLRLHGDLPGIILYIFDEQSTYQLIDLLMGLPAGTTKSIDDLSESAIKEIGNVLTGSFVTALSQMTGLQMITTVPVFAFDMLGAVLTSLMVAAGRVEDCVLVIETELSPQLDSWIKSHFFLLTEPGFLARLMSAMGLA